MLTRRRKLIGHHSYVVDLKIKEKVQARAKAKAEWLNFEIKHGGTQNIPEFLDGKSLKICMYFQKTIKDLKFEYWDFMLPANFARKNKRIILGLDRKLQFPYYYGQKRLSFFGSQEAMMANLTGDLEGWLANNFS